jgi:hypothetical protein
MIIGMSFSNSEENTENVLDILRIERVNIAEIRNYCTSLFLDANAGIGAKQIYGAFSSQQIMTVETRVKSITFEPHDKLLATCL